MTQQFMGLDMKLSQPNIRPINTGDVQLCRRKIMPITMKWCNFGYYCLLGKDIGIMMIADHGHASLDYNWYNNASLV